MELIWAENNNNIDSVHTCCFTSPSLDAQGRPVSASFSDEVSLVGKVLGALLLVGALLVVTLGFCYAYKGGYFVQRSEARDK